MQAQSIDQNKIKDKEGIAGLAKKLTLVMGELKRIPKSGVNSHFKYKYVTESDLLDAIRPLLAKHNVCIVPSIINYTEENYETRLNLLFTIIDGDSGATMSVPWASEAIDKQDKGISKAVTLGVKYFLKAFFLVSTGDLEDDPDSGASTGKDETKTKRVKGMKADNRPTPQASPLDDLRKSVHAELGKLSDSEIAKLAGIKKFSDLNEWRKKYSVLADAFEVIKKAYQKSETAKGDGDAETPPFEKATSKST